MNKHQRRAVTDLVAIVSAQYGLSMDDVLGDRRHKSVAEARLICYALLRDLTRMSYPEIGLAMQRDHTTVLIGCRNLARKAAKSEWLAKTLAECRRLVLEANEARRVA